MPVASWLWYDLQRNIDRLDVYPIGVLVEKIGVGRLWGRTTSSRKQLTDLFKILSDESKLELLLKE